MSYRLGAATVALLASCVTRPAYAQNGSSGRIEGIVFDSVHARPLANAHVVAVGTAAQSEVRRTATADSAGRYRIDSLPLGRYIVGFESALLDSLEVTISPREANLAAGQIATLDLALPSAARLRSAVCLGATLPPESGVIMGQVVNAETESPLAGVTVAMQWRDLGVDRQTLRPINRERSDSVITDRDGWYRMCGVPTGTWVSMQVQQDKRSGGVLRTRVGDTLGIAIRHLSVASGALASDEATTDGLAAAPLSGTAALNGVVRGPDGAPIAAADVRVRGASPAVKTDAQGAYSLARLPAGTQELEVRHVGFVVAESPVELRSGATTTHDVRLERVVVNLDSVRVVATRTRYPEFAEYRKNALGGVFLDPEDLAKQHVSRASDIIEKIPGFVVVHQGYHTDVKNGRGPPCHVNIVINDVIIKTQSEGAVTIDDVHPSEIGAIAAYRKGDPGIPIGYDRGCGAIAIWTKR
jgi:hypothetical protein